MMRTSRPRRAFIRSSSLAALGAWAGSHLPRVAQSASSLDGEQSTADQSSVGKSSRELIQRILPRHAHQFSVEIIAPENARDVFEIEMRNGTIVLRGSSGVAVASALNAYLKEYCNSLISWDCGDQLDLPEKLPAVPAKVRAASPHALRFAFNYCTHGYTMAWWEWARWEREIDLLALKGINLALIIPGQEAVWISCLRQFGYSERELREWLVLPTHQPWMYMSNMERYGGPLSPSLVARRVRLGQQIVGRMRALGIEPVLQGYYGMVPAGFGQRHPAARVRPQGLWSDLQRPDLLEPTDPLFKKIAAAFYREQSALFGKARFLAADPFHEGGNPQGIDLPACGRAIFDAMQGATWVLQSWAGNPRAEMIQALDKDKLLVLDLSCESQESWRQRRAFDGALWLWCTIHNFGGNVGMGGRLYWMGAGTVLALNDAAKGRMRGIGAVMEGSGGNPALWEMFLENAWRSSAPSLGPWLKDFTRRRYGASIPAAQRAWQILAATIYDAPAPGEQLPINSVICARPSLSADLKARAFVTTRPYYQTARLVEAWELMLAAAPQAQASKGYRYDLVDLGRQVLADLGRRYHRQIVDAYRAKDSVALRVAGKRMLGLIIDMDRLVGTRRELLLGVWLQGARAWGADDEEKSRFERSARELLTTWTAKDNITDYANRQWNGLLAGFYHRRWAMWIEALHEALLAGAAIDEPKIRAQIRDWEIAWTRRNERFPTRPRGDAVVLSRRLFEKYAADASGIEA